MMDESEYYDKLFELEKDMRLFQKENNEKILQIEDFYLKREDFYLKILVFVISFLGILMTLLKFWS